MYQTSGHKTSGNGRNRMAFVWLKILGYNRASIRKAFGKLTGISQVEIARQNDVERLVVAKNITGERRQADVQAMIAAAWDVPVEVAFER